MTATVTHPPATLPSRPPVSPGMFAEFAVANGIPEAEARRAAAELDAITSRAFPERQ